MTQYRNSSDARVAVINRRKRTWSEVAEKYIIVVLFSVISFLVAYTFHGFSDTLNQVRADVSSLQISFSALAQHVKDEDGSKESMK